MTSDYYQGYIQALNDVTRTVNASFIVDTNVDKLFIGRIAIIINELRREIKDNKNVNLD